MSHLPRLVRDLGICGCLVIWGGCGGEGRDPAGPDIPCFTLSMQPPTLTQQNLNGQLFLTPVQMIEFHALQGERVFFSTSSDEGAFSHDSSRVDTNAASNSMLNPDVWYSHLPAAEDTRDTIYAYCVDLSNTTLAWDSCTITITGSP